MNQYFNFKAVLIITFHIFSDGEGGIQANEK